MDHQYSLGNIKQIPGITDVPYSDAVRDFMFVNKFIGSGLFLQPRADSLSQFVVDLPSNFSARTLFGRNSDKKIFIGFDTELAGILLPMDFSILVNEEFFGLSVKALDSTFIIRIPFLPSICKLIADERLSSGLLSTETPSVADDDDGDYESVQEDSFFAELNREADLAKVSSEESDFSVLVVSYYTTFGSDFALREGEDVSRQVRVGIAGPQFSYN